jgi:hypothetical protein
MKCLNIYKIKPDPLDEKYLHDPEKILSMTLEVAQKKTYTNELNKQIIKFKVKNVLKTAC